MKKQAYFVYIVECKSKTLYTGITTDIKRRIEQHNGTKPGGAKYTRANGPVTLVHQEKYLSKSEALQREFQIKKMTREQKMQLTNT